MIANIEQTAAWISGTLRYGEETVVTPLPLYHVFALLANLLVFMKLGARNILIPDPRNLKALIAELEKVRFTVITGVNTLYRAMLDAPGFERVAAANRGFLKLAVAGGMAVQRAVAERWQQTTGVALVEGYGLTEASPIVCANPVAGRKFSGMLGLPVPSTDVSIRDDDGKELPLGEVGEICVRGPQVMRGYWKTPEETANVFTRDGWLRTGDLGRMHDTGYVEFVERRKDLIVVSGFKVFPGEVEQAAILHPGVNDAGAVGVKDEDTGEAVALFVVKRDPALTVDALREHCAKHLTRYKLPHHIRFVDAVPKTPIGKVLRRALKSPPYFPF
jgi:long-chain acyl-CoA synthetase